MALIRKCCACCSEIPKPKPSSDCEDSTLFSLRLMLRDERNFFKRETLKEAIRAVIFAINVKDMIAGLEEK